METPKNQHAVLVFTDLVDSVKLQQQIGAAAYSRVKSTHDRVFKAALALCPGAHIVESTGDGFYARFPTCSTAVETCLRFQYGLAHENDSGHTIKARVGIHCGEVFHDAEVVDQLLGMAPNITARVMSLALPGQILVTAPVYHDAVQYVRTHPDVSSNDRLPDLRWLNHGAYRLKGDPFPTQIFEVGALGIAPLITPPSSEKATRIRPDVAVDANEQSTKTSRVRLGTYGGILACLAVVAWLAFSRSESTPDAGMTEAKLPDVAATAPEVPSVGPLDGERTSGSQPNSKAQPRELATKEAQSPPLPLQDDEEEAAPTAASQSEPTTVQIARLICVEPNDLDGTDQVEFDLFVDGKQLPVKHAENYEGFPCTNMKAGDTWDLGIESTFRRDVLVKIRELGGIGGPLGKVTITPATLAQQVFETEMVSGGLGKNRYRLEWKLIEPVDKK